MKSWDYENYSHDAASTEFPLWWEPTDGTGAQVAPSVPDPSPFFAAGPSSVASPRVKWVIARNVYNPI